MLYQTENRHGGDIYGGIALDFSASVSPLGTPRSVTDAIERALPELYRYPDPYCRTLVQTISEYEGVPKNFVLCGNGASELIYAYCGAVRPKRAMELAPTFLEYSLALRRTGCEVVRSALKQEENFDKRNELIEQALLRVNKNIYVLPLHTQVINWALKKNIEAPLRADDRLELDKVIVR